MPDENEVINYFGYPPYYRQIDTNIIVTELPFRVRLPDGSTRTDPEQWASDAETLALAGYELTDITQQDIDTKKALLESTLPIVTLEQLKSGKLAELDSYYDNLFETGWQTPEGWYLGATVTDVSLLTGLFVLLKEAVALGLSTTMDVIDTEQVAHTLDLPTMTQLMLGYGNYRSELSDQYASIKKQINEAENDTQINAIIIGEENDSA